MAKFNFDEVIDRRGSSALKTDTLKERFGREDLIPMWIADMDFYSPPVITKAIIEQTKNSVLGYTAPSQSYFSSIVNWVGNEHNWKIEQNWLTFIPGIVKGISFAIDCFMQEDEKVIIQPPVYPPFRNVPNLRKREVVTNPLILESGRFQIDFNQLKQAITDNKARVLILCNPHNPGGRIWTKDELIKIAEICYDNKVLVVSDEIHCDLAFQNHKHIPFASVSEKAAQNSVTFMAPSKTFNIAGIVSSYSIIPNEKLREQFRAYLECAELQEGHIYAYTATEAAYTHGKEWLEEAKDYIWANICFTNEFLKEYTPQIKAIIPDASFLIWLDCRELGKTQKELVDFFVNDAKLALNDGITFGIEGEGFMRLNVGTSRITLAEALNNLKKALN